jgi:hypothetical protein
MHVQLLNLGFVKGPDGTNINQEIGLKIKIVDNQIVIMTHQGEKIVTPRDLEEVIGGKL